MNGKQPSGSYASQSDVNAINGKIPSAASTTNQLADRDFVNSSIENVAAFYITKNAAGDPFSTKAELNAATVFYSGGQVRIPTRNDYAVVLKDESKTIPATGEDPTTRYLYDNGWNYQYIVNNSGLTAAQFAAVNSGINSTLVGKISDVDNKIDKPSTAGTLGQVLTSDGNGGQSWQTPQGGGGGSGVYYCTYGTTTFGEITEALTDNLLPACVYGDRFYLYTGLSDGFYYFTTIIEESVYQVYIKNTWGSDSYDVSKVGHTHVSTDISDSDNAGELEIDNVPTEDSNNLITSGGVKAAIDGLQTKDIDDSAGYYTSDTVEGALSEIGGSLAGKQDAPAVITTGTNITLADNTEYRLTDVTSLTLTYPNGSFACWIKLTTAASGTITISLPESQYIGAAPTFGNGETWEISIRDGIVVAGKAASAS